MKISPELRAQILSETPKKIKDRDPKSLKLRNKFPSDEELEHISLQDFLSIGTSVFSEPIGESEPFLFFIGVFNKLDEFIDLYSQPSYLAIDCASEELHLLLQILGNIVKGVSDALYFHSIELLMRILHISKDSKLIYEALLVSRYLIPKITMKYSYKTCPIRCPNLREFLEILESIVLQYWSRSDDSPFRSCDFLSEITTSYPNDADICDNETDSQRCTQVRRIYSNAFYSLSCKLCSLLIFVESDCSSKDLVDLVVDQEPNLVCSIVELCNSEKIELFPLQLLALDLLILLVDRAEARIQFFDFPDISTTLFLQRCDNISHFMNTNISSETSNMHMLLKLLNLLERLLCDPEQYPSNLSVPLDSLKITHFLESDVLFDFILNIAKMCSVQNVQILLCGCIPLFEALFEKKHYIDLFHSKHCFRHISAMLSDVLLVLKTDISNDRCNIPCLSDGILYPVSPFSTVCTMLNESIRFLSRSVLQCRRELSNNEVNIATVISMFSLSSNFLEESSLEFEVEARTLFASCCHLLSVTIQNQPSYSSIAYAKGVPSALMKSLSPRNLSNLATLKCILELIRSLCLHQRTVDFFQNAKIVKALITGVLSLEFLKSSSSSVLQTLYSSLDELTRHYSRFESWTYFANFSDNIFPLFDTHSPETVAAICGNFMQLICIFSRRSGFARAFTDLNGLQNLLHVVFDQKFSSCDKGEHQVLLVCVSKVIKLIGMKHFTYSITSLQNLTYESMKYFSEKFAVPLYSENGELLTTSSECLFKLRFLEYLLSTLSCLISSSNRALSSNSFTALSDILSKVNEIGCCLSNVVSSDNSKMAETNEIVQSFLDAEIDLTSVVSNNRKSLSSPSELVFKYLNKSLASIKSHDVLVKGWESFFSSVSPVLQRCKKLVEGSAFTFDNINPVLQANIEWLLTGFIWFSEVLSVDLDNLGNPDSLRTLFTSCPFDFSSTTRPGKALKTSSGSLKDTNDSKLCRTFLESAQSPNGRKLCLNAFCGLVEFMSCLSWKLASRVAFKRSLQHQLISGWFRSRLNTCMTPILVCLSDHIYSNPHSQSRERNNNIHIHDQLETMGFSEDLISRAIDSVDDESVESIMEWISCNSEGSLEIVSQDKWQADDLMLDAREHFIPLLLRSLNDSFSSLSKSSSKSHHLFNQAGHKLHGVPNEHRESMVCDILSFLENVITCEGSNENPLDNTFKLECWVHFLNSVSFEELNECSIRLCSSMLKQVTLLSNCEKQSPILMRAIPFCLMTVESSLSKLKAKQCNNSWLSHDTAQGLVTPSFLGLYLDQPILHKTEFIVAWLNCVCLFLSSKQGKAAFEEIKGIELILHTPGNLKTSRRIQSLIKKVFRPLFESEENIEWKVIEQIRQFIRTNRARRARLGNDRSFNESQGVPLDGVLSSLKSYLSSSTDLIVSVLKKYCNFSLHHQRVYVRLKDVIIPFEYSRTDFAFKSLKFLLKQITEVVLNPREFSRSTMSLVRSEYILEILADCMKECQFYTELLLSHVEYSDSSHDKSLKSYIHFFIFSVLPASHLTEHFKLRFLTLIAQTLRSFSHSQSTFRCIIECYNSSEVITSRRCCLLLIQKLLSYDPNFVSHVIFSSHDIFNFLCNLSVEEKPLLSILASISARDVQTQLDSKSLIEPSLQLVDTDDCDDSSVSNPLIHVYPSFVEPMTASDLDASGVIELPSSEFVHDSEFDSADNFNAHNSENDDDEEDEDEELGTREEDGEFNDISRSDFSQFLNNLRTGSIEVPHNRMSHLLSRNLPNSRDFYQSLPAIMQILRGGSRNFGDSRQSSSNLNNERLIAERRAMINQLFRQLIESEEQELSPQSSESVTLVLNNHDAVVGNPVAQISSQEVVEDKEEAPPHDSFAYMPPTDHQRSAAEESVLGYDPAVLAELPEEIQAEILAQVSLSASRVPQNESISYSISGCSDMDQASMLACLPQEIKEEIFLSQSEDFLLQLPPSLLAEAVRVRSGRLPSERRSILFGHRDPDWEIDEAPLDSEPNEYKVNEFRTNRILRKGSSFLPDDILSKLCSLLAHSKDHETSSLVFNILNSSVIYEKTSVAILNFLLSLIRNSDSVHCFNFELVLRIVDVVVCEIDANNLQKCLTAQDMLHILERWIFSFRSLNNWAVLSHVFSILSRFCSQEENPLQYSLNEEFVQPFQKLMKCVISFDCPKRIFETAKSVVNLVCSLKTEQCENFLHKFAAESVDEIRSVIDHKVPQILSWLDEYKIHGQKSQLNTTTNTLTRAVELLRIFSSKFPNNQSDIIHSLQNVWDAIDNLLSSFKSHANCKVSVHDLAPLILLYFKWKDTSLSSFSWGDNSVEHFRSFCSTHRDILNALCESRPELLNGVLSVLLSHPGKILDFANKCSFLKSKLKAQRSQGSYRKSVRLFVRRESLFEDSYHQMKDESVDNLKGSLSIKFANEEGVDAGGLTREWYMLLSREIFNPNYALFRQSADKAAVFQPNKFSYWNPDHLDFFKFVGRFLGKSIYDGCTVDAYFTRSFYKHILGVAPSFSDLESMDPDFYKSLKWMLENSIDNVLDLTFSADVDEFGFSKIVDLKANGRHIRVNDSNKEEYVRLVTELRTTKEIRSQINSFLKGFHQLIPQELISIFNEQELELLICGLPDIDISDMKLNTEYRGFTRTSQVIQWLWQVVEEYDKNHRALFLQFVTGTSKVPLEGFKALQGMHGIQPIQIHRISGVDRLPSAHTCFNQLDLPEFSSLESLRTKLSIAITECSHGFQFA